MIINSDTEIAGLRNRIAELESQLQEAKGRKLPTDLVDKIGHSLELLIHQAKSESVISYAKKVSDEFKAFLSNQKPEGGEPITEPNN